MKTTALHLVALGLPALLLLVLVLGPTAVTAGEHKTKEPATAAHLDLVDTAVKDGRFKVLASALREAGLIEALKGDGPLTVFAPTDEAFGQLPKGAVAALLKDKAALTRVLTLHVVPGRVLAGDLLKVTSATSLSGAPLPIGLRVGNANVIQADLRCTNGVIHVIDQVLLPAAQVRTSDAAPQTTHASRPALDPTRVIVDAIDRGAPLFNEGHIEACVKIYRDAAARLLGAEDAVTDLDRMNLAAALVPGSKDAKAQAWALRRAFDTLLANAAFEPRMEASLPAGFPAPGPVGRVVRKRYPKYRAARASGGNTAFWTLFQHIKSNKVEMTAPVEMTMDGNMRARDMAFLYERPGQGKAGSQGRVDVLDLDAIDVLSIGMRGRRTKADLALAKQLIEARLAADGLEATGPFRALGYNSPMVPAAQQYWELQVPIRRVRAGS